MKQAIITVLFSLSALFLGAETISFPNTCQFSTGDGGRFPSSDKEFFEKLQSFNCPEVSYSMPGYRYVSIEDRWFIITWDWRGGVAGSVLGICRRSKKGFEDSLYSCYFPDPNWNSEQFEKERKHEQLNSSWTDTFTSCWDIF
jgi:hypothetical protein